MEDLIRIESMSWFRDQLIKCDFSYDVQEFEDFRLDGDYIQLVFNNENSWAYA
jgi:hypothetical protein|tara:strand:+ start:396 stop:554 length:159 start_codon:yes stop_codon:yes gene_type:complete